MRCCKYKATWQGLAGQAQEGSLLAAKHFYLREARRYTTVVLTAFEERTVDCIVDCLSASGFNPLVGNSGARARNQSGIYLKSNRKYKRKCEDHAIKKKKHRKREAGGQKATCKNLMGPNLKVRITRV